MYISIVLLIISCQPVAKTPPPPSKYKIDEEVCLKPGCTPAIIKDITYWGDDYSYSLSYYDNEGERHFSLFIKEFEISKMK